MAALETLREGMGGGTSLAVAAASLAAADGVRGARFEDLQAFATVLAPHLTRTSAADNNYILSMLYHWTIAAPQYAPRTPLCVAAVRHPMPAPGAAVARSLLAAAAAEHREGSDGAPPPAATAAAAAAPQFRVRTNEVHMYVAAVGEGDASGVVYLASQHTWRRAADVALLANGGAGGKEHDAAALDVLAAEELLLQAAARQVVAALAGDSHTEFMGVPGFDVTEDDHTALPQLYSTGRLGMAAGNDFGAGPGGGGGGGGARRGGRGRASTRGGGQGRGDSGGGGSTAAAAADASADASAAYALVDAMVAPPGPPFLSTPHAAATGGGRQRSWIDIFGMHSRNGSGASGGSGSGAGGGGEGGGSSDAGNGAPSLDIAAVEAGSSFAATTNMLAYTTDAGDLKSPDLRSPSFRWNESTGGGEAKPEGVTVAVADGETASAADAGDGGAEGSTAGAATGSTASGDAAPPPPAPSLPISTVATGSTAALGSLRSPTRKLKPVVSNPPEGADHGGMPLERAEDPAAVYERTGPLSLAVTPGGGAHTPYRVRRFVGPATITNVVAQAYAEALSRPGAHGVHTGGGGGAHVKAFKTLAVYEFRAPPPLSPPLPAAAGGAASSAPPALRLSALHAHATPGEAAAAASGEAAAAADAALGAMELHLATARRRADTAHARGIRLRLATVDDYKCIAHDFYRFYKEHYDAEVPETLQQARAAALKAAIEDGEYFIMTAPADWLADATGVVDKVDKEMMEARERRRERAASWVALRGDGTISSAPSFVGSGASSVSMASYLSGTGGSGSGAEPDDPLRTIPIGMASVRGRHPGGARIAEVYVKDEYRRRGFAVLILNMLVARLLVKERLPSLCLLADAGNGAIARLMARTGFATREPVVSVDIVDDATTHAVCADPHSACVVQ